MVPMGGPSVCRMFAQLGNQAQLGAQGSTLFNDNNTLSLWILNVIANDICTTHVISN
jgi:hypothetical protein